MGFVHRNTIKIKQGHALSQVVLCKCNMHLMQIIELSNMLSIILARNHK